MFYRQWPLALAAALPLISHLHAVDEKPAQTIAISASATISAPADELQLSLGVRTISDTATAALETNSLKMKSVIASLEASGVSAKNYTTSRFTLNPTYTPYPKNPPENWKPSINGYEVSNMVVVTTDQLDLAGNIIDAAITAGANSVEKIDFVFHNPRGQWQKVIALATEHAMEDAALVAKTAGVKLGKVLSITLSHSNSNGAQPTLFYAKEAALRATPPIQGGDAELSATASILYALEPSP